jgi:hypothetical protein
MTYKKRHKYRKTIKRKKRGGAALLKGLTAAKGAAASASSGLSSAKGLTGSSGAAGSSGLNNAMSQVESAASTSAATTGLPSGAGLAGAGDLKGAAGKLAGLKGKGSPSPYVIIAEFILKQKSKANINYALASKLFKSPRLRENKYKKIINELKTEHMENFKCACKLIYLYYYDEYATNFSFMFDNSQDIDNICKILYVVNQQILMYSSSKTKLLSHFNEIFENSNFSNLYKKNLLNVENDCNTMRHKIQELFKKNYAIAQQVKNWNNKTDSEQKIIIKKANDFIDNL